MNTTDPIIDTSTQRTHHAIPMHTGHHRQPDGSVIRVDFERGQWIGSLYSPALTLEMQIVGDDAAVHAWADRIAA